MLGFAIQMLCTIYKSPKREETYLYVVRKDDFSSVPKALIEHFGKPVFVTVLKLDAGRGLANADPRLVQAELAEKGFYLQLPPPKENLLKTLRRENGLDVDE